MQALRAPADNAPQYDKPDIRRGLSRKNRAPSPKPPAARRWAAGAPA